jgi:hypothetical protein
MDNQKNLSRNLERLINNGLSAYVNDTYFVLLFEPEYVAEKKRYVSGRHDDLDYVVITDEDIGKASLKGNVWHVGEYTLEFFNLVPVGTEKNLLDLT